MRRTTKIAILAITASCLVASARAQETQLFWGDTHLHTNYSADAYFLNNKTADPDTAYRWAKGLPVIHPYSRAKIQIETPLDFLVVSDHAEMMGVVRSLFMGDPRLAGSEVGKRFMQMAKEGKGQQVFEELVATVNSNQPIEALNKVEIRAGNWSDIVDAADRHNDPGTFTSFIGWEWSSIFEGANLHRVVFMPQDGDVAKKFVPYSAFDSQKPEDLWAWLEKTSKETGAEFVAIPHNSNVSKGLMFDKVDSEGRPISAEYARTRMRWEPVVEMTQIKGDSETHPALSPNDEFADYEFYPHLLDTRPGADRTPTTTPGDYVRAGMMRGLEIESQVGANPYKFGLIGSTDAHTGMASAEEDNYWGKSGLDSIPEMKDKPVLSGSRGWDMSAAGLAAVWATENSREAITAAFKRKEVYATTGPRIGVRFFGGWDFGLDSAAAKDIAALGYSKGVPMGGDLTKGPEGEAPSFLVHAAKDPRGGNLDRLQIVKGWLDGEGKSHEKIYNVAWSEGRDLKEDGSLPPVGNTVDLKTAAYTNTIGNAQLSAAWTDPGFDASQRAFYYIRVLQIPTPRHSLYDAVALGIEHPKDFPPTIQERAYTSAIWYTP